MLLRDRILSLLVPDTTGPMRYALDMRTFWFSHYLSTGLRTSSGILLIALAALALLPPGWAMAAAFGAAALALVDQLGPLRYKRRELGVSLLLNTLAALWVGMLTPWPLAQAASMVLLTFGSALLLLYGNRAMPVQFAMLLAMTLSVEHIGQKADPLATCASFFLGGLCYFVYALGVAWWQRHRLKQQVLAECLFELARYFDIKSGFYERSADIEQQFTRLIRQQVVLADRQQAARDLVLQPLQGPQDARLIQIHLGMLDVYEQVLSTHTDYRALHQHFGQSDIMLFLRDLIAKATRDVEAVAFAVTRGLPSESPVTYVAEQRAIAFELHLMEQGEYSVPVSDDVFLLLRSTYYKILDTITRIKQMHAATHSSPEQLPAIDMTLFVSRPRIDWNLLQHNLNLQSPIFRYALRISLAMVAALLLVQALPYKAHAYWIMLTIVIIMKPSYSMTRDRRRQRMLGTVLGCIVAAVVLQVVQGTLPLLLVLYLSLMVSSTFVQLRYVYTATAATLTVLVLLHLTTSQGGPGLVMERLMDTALGVLIATVFAYVFPNWERQALPGLLQRLFDGARRYLRESHALLLGDVTQDEAYRLSRKQFLNEIAGVNAALLRMLDEPHVRQRGISEINRLLVRTYLMTSHVAALRMLLRRQPWLQRQADYRQQMQESMVLTHALVEEARTILCVSEDSCAPVQVLELPEVPGTDQQGTADGMLPVPETPQPEGERLPHATHEVHNVLEHRIRALREDAADLVEQSRRVKAVLAPE